ncbi:hypothetical protein KI688_005258 [Linnemannia hyalina]|uniref:Uncharacterized protein n=1 Tax=Linnemannia hyalina TaxID=64524 RepID=A0A9P7XKU7_9FUNG|nr:hypothetical protein KI688_005258 [Linnemannia hyalina]
MAFLDGTSETDAMLCRAKTPHCRHTSPALASDPATLPSAVDKDDENETTIDDLNIMDVCRKKYKKDLVVDDGEDVLETDLTELKAELERDLSKVKLSLPDTLKRPKATENSTLFVWHVVWHTT